MSKDSEARHLPFLQPLHDGVQMCRRGGTGPCRQAMFPRPPPAYKQQQRVSLFSQTRPAAARTEPPQQKYGGRGRGAYPLPKNTLPETFFSCWKTFRLPNERISVTNNPSEKCLAARKLKENPCSISTRSPM